MVELELSAREGTNIKDDNKRGKHPANKIKEEFTTVRASMSPELLPREETGLDIKDDGKSSPLSRAGISKDNNQQIYEVLEECVITPATMNDHTTTPAQTECATVPKDNEEPLYALPVKKRAGKETCREVTGL